MDNVAIRCVERFINEKLPYDENGNYLIIQIEGDNEEKLEDYAMRIDELCSANGGLELLVAKLRPNLESPQIFC